MQIGTELAPVAAGRAAAAALYEPQVDQGIASGYKIIYAFPKAYPGGYAFSTMDTLASTIKSKPAMVAAFVKSIAQAEALIQQSPDTAKAVAVAEFPTLDKKIVESAVDRLTTQKIYAPTPEISRAGVPQCAGPAGVHRQYQARQRDVQQRGRRFFAKATAK